MSRPLAALLLALSAVPVVPQVPLPDPQVELGVRQVNEGRLEEAVFTLDTAIKSLIPEATTKSRDLVRAFLYKGAALVGLAQEEPAKASFREALRLEPKLRLTTDAFSPRVVRVFEAARTGKAKSVMEPPMTAPKKAGLGGLGVAAIVGGAVLIGGGVAIAAVGSSPAAAPSQPTASLTVSPQGQAITGVTIVTFTAAVSPGVPTYRWSFGDGGSGSGQAVTHIYASEGAFAVNLTVSESGRTSTASATVSARPLSGTWMWGTTPFYLMQSGPSLVGQWGGESRGGIGAIQNGVVTSPRNVSLRAETYEIPPVRPGFPSFQTVGLDVIGTVDSALQTISGVATPYINPGSLPATFSIVLTRQP